MPVGLIKEGFLGEVNSKLIYLALILCFLIIKIMYFHGNKFAIFKFVKRVKETKNLLSKDNHYSDSVLFLQFCSLIFST